MNKFNNFNLKKFFTLIAALALAFCLTFSVACSGGDNSSSTGDDDDDDVKVTATDYQVLKNGDFEFGTDDDDVSYPVYTGINWTKYRDNSYSTSAISSSKNSGIIDTEGDAYSSIASVNGFPKDGDAYWNPKTPQSLELVDADAYYVYDEETASDNPNEDKLLTKGSKILMIHNVSSVEGAGTAQKFVSSSSLTTTTGYAKLSVWVLTKDLKSIQQGVDFGAYVSVNNTLSSSRAPLLIKNIDTKGVWANYVIYLEASDYAKSSYTVTVGLGFGSDTYQREYVEGFAYFDDIHFEELTAEEYASATAAVDSANKVNLFDNNGNAKDDLTQDQAGKTYVANENKNATKVEYAFSHLIENTDLAFAYDYFEGSCVEGVPASYKVMDAHTFGKGNLPAGVTNPKGDVDVLSIKLDTPSSYVVTTKSLPVDKDDHIQVNFLTNVMVGARQTGATIQVEELDASGKVLGTIDVASNYNTYSTDDKAQTWKKVSIFLANELETASGSTTRYIRFKFTLGTTSVKDLNQGDYDKVLTKGYALFTGFEGKLLTEEEYGIVSSEADYKSTITLGYEYPNGPADDEDDANDSFAYTATASTKADLKKKPATGVSGYTGVHGGGKAIGGTSANVWIHQNGVSGVVSSKYIDAYASLTSAEKDAIKALAGDKNIQPIVIKNTSAASYGYLGSSLTFSAHTTTLVSVQVKVLDDANAYVYLANADSLSDYSVLDLLDSDLVVKVTKDSAPSNGWVTVNFLVTAGNEDITYRVELWNGTRDGNGKSTGTVLFNTVTTSTSVDKTALIAKLDNNFVSSDSDIVTKEHKRADVTVKYTDDDGNNASYTVTYDPEVVYTSYVKGSTIIASYETVDADTEIDNTTTTDDSSSDDSSDEEDEATVGGTIWALQITSIIVAAVLVLVLIIVVIRMLVKKHQKVVIDSSNYYNRNSREKAQAVINANKAKRAEQALNADATAQDKPADDVAEEATEEEKPYDYDNPENNI